tara:strand:- start:224 stop:1018 length:795 start_codon:yes stop_codon:yes gene_type:complete
MNILICGDVVGRTGREIIEKKLPYIISKEEIDFVIVNGENSAGGFGINKKICENFYSLGVDVITTGNHVWDQKDILDTLNNDPRILRPNNYSKNCPGKGVGIFQTSEGSKIIVINIMCRLFMENIDDPFLVLDQTLKQVENVVDPIIIVDVHGEATSEKMAIGHFLDGRVSAVVGTHTHVPTSDLHIMKKGTFYQSDLGMCGDYDSVVGMNKEISILKFTNQHLKIRHEPATGDATLSGVILKIDKNRKIKEFKQILKEGILGK